MENDVLTSICTLIQKEMQRAQIQTNDHDRDVVVANLLTTIASMCAGAILMSKKE
jgi:hypothetical protein